MQLTSWLDAAGHAHVLCTASGQLNAAVNYELQLIREGPPQNVINSQRRNASGPGPGSASCLVTVCHSLSSGVFQ